MKILSLVHRYHPAVGGAESHMAAINKRLVGRGHSVTVLTSDAADFALFWDPAAQRFEVQTDEHDGVQILRFPVRHLPFSKYAFPATRILTGWLARLMPSSPITGQMIRLTPRIPAMQRWLNSCADSFDIVIGMTITIESIMQMGQDFAHRQGIPFMAIPLAHLGTGREPGADRASLFYTLPQQNALVLKSDGLIATNPAEKEYYAERNMPTNRIVTAPPAPDRHKVMGGNGAAWRQEFGVHEDEPLIVTISTLAREKGTFDTLEAMQTLWAKGEKAKLVLAGTIMPDVDAYLASLDPAEKEHLIVRGKITDAERNDLLAAANVFCMPSVVESFGIAFTEAMLYKKPVIGATVWGVTDFVICEGENGFLVEPGNISGLATLIQTLIHDQEQARAMGEKGFQVASGLSYKRSVDQIEALITQVTQSHKPAGGGR